MWFLLCPLHYLANCLRSLARLVEGVQWHPRGRGSIPVWSKFPVRGVKKSPRLFPFPKHGLRSGLTHKATDPPCTGGAGVRGFSWPVVRRSFYLSNNAVGAVLPPAGQVFFFFFELTEMGRPIHLVPPILVTPGSFSGLLGPHKTPPTYPSTRTPCGDEDGGKPKLSGRCSPGSRRGS